MKKENKPNSKHKKPNTNKGITLIALIVTIVIMLILAGVTINVTVDGGLFGKAQSAKNSAEKAQDIEKITKAIIYAKEKDRSGKLTVENLQKELSEAKAFEEAGTIIVKLNGTYYEVGENGHIESLGKVKEKTLTIICKDSTGKEIAKKEHTILKSNYLITPPEVEDFEPADEKLEGEISENKEITLTYYKILDDDTELVFTGLNSSGAVTTVESEIVSYMVGDGTNLASNGLKEKGSKGILKIPDTYKNKPVSKLSNNAFYSASIFKIEIGKNITNLTQSCFRGISVLQEVVFNGNISNMFNSFDGCNNWTIVRENSEDLIVKNGILYSADEKTLICVPIGMTGTIIVPDSVEKIATYAFFGTNAEKIVVSDNVSQMGKYAICSNVIKELVLGRKINEISELTIYSCSNLEEVTFKARIKCFWNNFSNSTKWKNIKEDSEELVVENNILYTSDKKVLVKVPIAFDGELIIPEGVEEIGAYAVAYANVKKVKITKDVSSVDIYAFMTNISEVTLDSSQIASELKSKTSVGYLVNSATTIYIKNDITTIGSYITDNFTTVASDKEGYTKYVKK